MDPRDRADVVLSKARARGSFVVTPDNATSPMDAANTQQIARSVVSEIDQFQDPDQTTVLPASLIAANDHPLAEAQHTKPLRKPSGQTVGKAQVSASQPPPQRSALEDTSEQEPASKDAANGTEKPKPAKETAQLGGNTLGAENLDELDGLVPTITQNSGGRSSLSRTLDGLD